MPNRAMDPTLYMLVICSGVACKPFDPPERYTMDLATCRAKAVIHRADNVDLRCQSQWQIDVLEVVPRPEPRPSLPPTETACERAGCAP